MMKKAPNDKQNYCGDDEFQRTPATEDTVTSNGSILFAFGRPWRLDGG
jgi:hypothetical protein